MSGPLVKIVTFSAFIIPLVGQLSFFKRPCIPIQPGFFLIEHCNNFNVNPQFIPETSLIYGHSLPVPPLLTVSVLAVYTFFSRAYMLNSFVAQMSIGLVIKPYCLHSYILLVKQISTKLSISPPYQFRLGCKYYNQLQVFVKNYNNIYKRSTVCNLIFNVGETILSSYACISLAQFLPFERRLIFGCTAFDMIFCAIIIFDMLANIYEESKRILDFFHKNYEKELMTKSINKRLLKSFAPLKMSLGSGNFVEASTPPACQQMIIERTVDLTLLN